MAEPKTKVPDESAKIIVNDQGVPVIAGADFKVRQIAMDYIEMGNDVAGIQRQHPFLSKAQIRLAISYTRGRREPVLQWSGWTDLVDSVQGGAVLCERVWRHLVEP